MSREYNGWKLLDKIIIVKTANNHYKYGCPQGYVVDPSNKKQLESAKSWGGNTIYERDENGNYVKDANGNYVKHYEGAEIVETSNCDFKLTLLDCAGGSSQGGKLSFWNCLIEKDDDKYVIGINSELLLELMLQSTFKNGVCDKKICFARKNGNVGALHTGMTQYKDALNDTALRKDVSTKKTTKWQIGSNYITLNNNDFYLGEIYQPILFESILENSYNISKDIRNKLAQYNPEIASKQRNYYYSSYINVYQFNVDRNRKMHVTIDDYYLREALGKEPSSDISLEEYIKACRTLLNKKLELEQKSKDNYYSLDAYDDKVAYAKYNLLARTPSRKYGGVSLSNYDTYYDDVNDLVKYWKETMLKVLKKGKYSTSYGEVTNAIKSIDGSITDTDIELIHEIFKLSRRDSNNYTLYKVINNGVEEYLYTSEQVFNRIKELLQ